MNKERTISSRIGLCCRVETFMFAIYKGTNLSPDRMWCDSSHFPQRKKTETQSSGFVTCVSIVNSLKSWEGYKSCKPAVLNIQQACFSPNKKQRLQNGGEKPPEKSGILWLSSIKNELSSMKPVCVYMCTELYLSTDNQDCCTKVGFPYFFCSD